MTCGHPKSRTQKKEEKTVESPDQPNPQNETHDPGNGHDPDFPSGRRIRGDYPPRRHADARPDQGPRQMHGGPIQRPPSQRQSDTGNEVGPMD